MPRLSQHWKWLGLRRRPVCTGRSDCCCSLSLFHRRAPFRSRRGSWSSSLKKRQKPARKKKLRETGSRCQFGGPFLVVSGCGLSRLMWRFCEILCEGGGLCQQHPPVHLMGGRGQGCGGWRAKQAIVTAIVIKIKKKSSKKSKKTIKTQFLFCRFYVARCCSPSPLPPPLPAPPTTQTPPHPPTPPGLNLPN